MICLIHKKVLRNNSNELIDSEQKHDKKIFIVVIAIFLISCNRSEKEEHFNYVSNNFIESTEFFFGLKWYKKGHLDSMRFSIYTNPYNWQKKKMILTVNDQVAFYDYYVEDGTIKFNMEENNTIEIRLFIIENDKIICFEEKESYLWNSSYKILIIGIYPNFDGNDPIHFSPRKNFAE